VQKEVEAALWAWETFGGLGARTRRGFGALHLVAINGEANQSLPSSREVESWIQNKASTLRTQIGSFPPGMPYLGGSLNLAVTPPSVNPMQAWNRLIRKLQNFRQQKDASNRSAWPEADTIREVARKGPVSQIQKFPRAAFGLPVIFHFTGNNAPEGNYTLNEAAERKDPERKNPPNKERFASPLILRPFLCSDKRAVGLALLLDGSRVDLEHLVLQDDEKNRNNAVQWVRGVSTLNGVLTSTEAKAIAKKSAEARDGKDNLRVLQNETDVLQAFMKSFKGV
jgi:CRISPR-associated protein Cmr1